MKKLAIVAKTIILSLILALSTASCGSSSSDEAKTQTNADTTSYVSNAKEGDAFQATTNIRYIDLDSVLANYTLSKEIQDKGQRIMVDLQQKQASREKELQTLGNSIQQKLNSNGYLSEDSYKADVNSFNNKQAQAQNYLASEQQKASNVMAIQEQRLNDSINNFIVDYNATHHYDAILYKAAGVYFNPALDITKEVIEGLNKRYKSTESTDTEKE